MDDKELQEIKTTIQVSRTFWIAEDAEERGLVLTRETLLALISTIEGLKGEVAAYKSAISMIEMNIGSINAHDEIEKIINSLRPPQR